MSERPDIEVVTTIRNEIKNLSEIKPGSLIVSLYFLLNIFRNILGFKPSVAKPEVPQSKLKDICEKINNIYEENKIQPLQKELYKNLLNKLIQHGNIDKINYILDTNKKGEGQSLYASMKKHITKMYFNAYGDKDIKFMETCFKSLNEFDQKKIVYELMDKDIQNPVYGIFSKSIRQYKEFGIDAKTQADFRYICINNQ